ncbi:MAG: class I SAM-dependent methyltransferase [Hyphomicrobiales bacterium]|nr:MAG: class I SAM-dependent methyltransferase [Hyphomicrobiales bacterium]
MSTKSYVGDIPINYDRGLGNVLFLPYAEEAAHRVAAANPMEVLEIAAGSGVATRALLDQLASAARLTATDISEDMLNVARSKALDDERVSFKIVDACALPYEDESFDAIVCMFGFMFFPDKPRAIREAYRVLRNGGRYTFSVWDSEENNPYVSEALAVLQSFFPNDPPQWIMQPTSCAVIGPIKKSLVDAGFDDIRISVLPYARPFDALAFARGIVFGSPVLNEVTERGGDLDEIAHAYGAALTRAVGSTLPIQAIMLEAQKL